MRTTLLSLIALLAASMPALAQERAPRERPGVRIERRLAEHGRTLDKHARKRRLERLERHRERIERKIDRLRDRREAGRRARRGHERVPVDRPAPAPRTQREGRQGREGRR